MARQFRRSAQGADGFAPLRVDRRRNGQPADADRAS